jgi:hypothetical protein
VIAVIKPTSFLKSIVLRLVPDMSPWVPRPEGPGVIDPMGPQVLASLLCFQLLAISFNFRADAVVGVVVVCHHIFPALIFRS